MESMSQREHYGIMTLWEQLRMQSERMLAS
nr:MAG TPA: hypothetical protein [Caudoviricetes sp.]